MPLVYQQDINEDAKIGVWHITEADSFFLKEWTPSIEIQNERKRIQHLAGRYLLKVLQPDFPLQDILVSSNGMPYLKEEDSFFSISHCDEYAAVVISKNKKAGIDIETVRTKIGLIKERFLSLEEMGLMQQTGLEIMTQYTIGWTIKEALFKWYGKGSVDFRKNLIIESIETFENDFLFDVVFLKDGMQQKLRVQSKLLLGRVLSWVKE